jgi:hypothetical protein
VKAQIKIEAMYDNVVQEMKAWTTLANAASPGLGDRTFGKPFTGPWCAKITGKDTYYGYKREFVQGKKDYTHANSKGSRGVFVYFLVESGFVYEVKGSRRRYFCAVLENGDIAEISKEDVEEWIIKQEVRMTRTQEATPNEDWELPY